MVSFSLRSETIKNIDVCVAVIWFICFIALSVPTYHLIQGGSLDMVKLNYFMKSFLFLSYFCTAMLVWCRYLCSRIVDVYLPYGIESINKSDFMEYVKNGNVRYIEETSNTQYIRSMTFDITKEEYNLLRQREASKEVSKFKYKIDRAK